MITSISVRIVWVKSQIFFGLGKTVLCVVPALWKINGDHKPASGNICCHISLRSRSQLSTFMKAYREYARGEGVWDHCMLFPQNQHLFLITDNLL